VDRPGDQLRELADAGQWLGEAQIRKGEIRKGVRSRYESAPAPFP
jgi:hypothetical protein